MKKYLLGYLLNKLSPIIEEAYDKEAWKKLHYSLKQVIIKNKSLASELEEACKKRDGFLTYGEYLEISLYGKNGYQTTHYTHGITNGPKRWGKAVAKIVKERNNTKIIDFGCGDGSLAYHALKELNPKIPWTGVEINPKLNKETLSHLSKSGIDSSIIKIVSGIEEIEESSSPLLTFMYSLDNITPEMFINTASKTSFPDSLVGIVVENNILKEIILSEKELLKRGLSFNKGSLFIKNVQFDLSKWRLIPNQRALIPIHAFLTLRKFCERFPKNSLLIIDEFAKPPQKEDIHHLSLPRDLQGYRGNAKGLKNLYEESGESLLYFTTYTASLASVLTSLGYKFTTGIEEELANTLIGKKWKDSGKIYLCHAFIGELVEKSSKIILIDPPPTQ